LCKAATTHKFAALALNGTLCFHQGCISTCAVGSYSRSHNWLSYPIRKADVAAKVAFHKQPRSIKMLPKQCFSTKQRRLQRLQLFACTSTIPQRLLLNTTCPALENDRFPNEKSRRYLRSTHEIYPRPDISFGRLAACTARCPAEKCA
jgi:hypothetical protein